MIKGVNRSVIEVNETNNKYFEKVIFYVNPSFNGMPFTKLKTEAENIVVKYGIKPKTTYAEKVKKIMLNRIILATSGLILLTGVFLIIKAAI